MAIEKVQLTYPDSVVARWWPCILLTGLWARSQR